MEFKWSVSTAGYEIEEGRIPFIMDRAAVTQGISPHRRTYEPLDDPALYLRLARTPTEPEAILKFVNHHGLLEMDDWHYQTPENSPQRGPSCEPLPVWVEVIEELRTVLRIFEFIQTNQILKLRDCIEVEEIGPDELANLATQAAVQIPTNLRATVSMLDPSNPLKRLEKLLIGDPDLVQRDPVAHAASYVARVSNNWLRERVAPRVFWDQIERRFQIRMTPTCLLGAVWLQLSLALADNKRLGTCGRCGEPFEISRKSSRADRKHCSNKCRSKAYRHRIDTAIGMASNHTPEQIAEELGSDLETVRGWIRQHDETTGNSGGDDK